MDFAAMFQTWINVLTRPGEATLAAERERPQASLRTAIIWIILAAILAAIFSAISAVVSGLIGGGMAGMSSLLDQADLPPEVRAQLAGMLASGAGSAGASFCFTLVLAPLGFLIGSGIYYLIARLLGGTGSYEDQTYLLATFTAPLTILSSLINIIPFLGPCVGFFISIYQLVLTYFALKVAHNLTSGRAAAAVLIPVVVLILCAVCGFLAAFFAIISMASNMPQ